MFKLQLCLAVESLVQTKRKMPQKITRMASRNSLNVSILSPAFRKQRGQRNDRKAILPRESSLRS
jgi:hypothetical protein